MHAFHPVGQMDGRVVSTLVHVGWSLLHCMRRDCGARSLAARNRCGRRAGAFAERAARCTRAQGGGGGVIAMDKGAALFDGVAISNAEAQVRAGQQRWVSGPIRVGGAGAVSDGGGGGCGSAVRSTAVWSR